MNGMPSSFSPEATDDLRTTVAKWLVWYRRPLLKTPLEAMDEMNREECLADADEILRIVSEHKPSTGDADV